jgi:Histidine phosphatase superfamily (branch 1)
MRRLALLFALGMLLYSAMVVLVACGAVPPIGFEGHAFVREPNGDIGPTIPGVEIRFLSEDGSTNTLATTDGAGSYRVSLGRGRYWVIATHPAYEDYSSAPGFFVVTGRGYQTGNIFLMKPRLTTVLLVRHAERGNDHLTSDGIARRDKLAEVAQKAGVTAIYATSARRTQQTVQALADMWKTDVITEDNAVNLVTDGILATHLGDVALVASHSGSFGGSYSTVPNVIAALGAAQCEGEIYEYDNLYVVSRAAGGASQTNVLNLQYDQPTEPSAPDGVRCANQMTTVLLVPHAETGAAGQVRGAALTHVVRKAGVAAVFGTSADLEPANTLAKELGLPVRLYNPGTIQELIKGILADWARRVVVIAGDKSAMSEIIHQLGGSPFPVILPDEHDSLFVITVSRLGDATVLGLQYGDPSPVPVP